MLLAPLLAPLLMIAACDRPAEEQARQPGVAADIVDRTPTTTQDQDAGPPVNAVASGEPARPATATPGSIPAGLHGRWTGMTARCDDRSADLELTVEPDRLIFHESVGAVTDVRDGTDGAISVTAAFTGEGQSWTRTMTLRPSADGRTLAIAHDGATVTRKRC